MNQEVKRTQRDYSLTFKLSVVDQVERGELSCSEAQTRYGIQSYSTVLTWLRKHGHQDWSRGASAPRLRSPTMASIPLTPEQRIKELETKLFDAEQKAEFFKAVIEVLDKDFGVSVVKKRPGKSSRTKALPG